MENTVTPDSQKENVQAPQPAPVQPVTSAPPPVNTPPVQKKGNMGKIVLIILIIIIIVAAAFGYFYYKMQEQKMQSAKEAKMATQATNAPKTFVIGVDSTYPPMESVTSSGQYVGFDIDMGNMIAKDLGRKAVWKTVEFSDIFNDLNKNEFDVIISSVTITPQRQQLYDFSIPYLNAGEVLIVRKTNTAADSVVETAADFEGKKIGVQSGTTDLAEAMKLTSPNLVVQYPSNIPALTDLQSGKIDALLTDLPDARGVLTANPGFRIATNPLTTEYYGIVFRKNEPQLKNQVNTVLENLQNQGILQDLTKKWLD